MDSDTTSPEGLTAPTVSIVMPVHNAECFLSETLASIENQTMRDFEVLCVLNGCTDASEDIVREFGKRDLRFLPILIGQASAARARNEGLSRAKGKYVIFLDADDVFAPNFIHRMSYALDEFACDLAICEADAFTVDGRSTKIAFFPEEIDYGLINLQSHRGDLLYSLGAAPWNKMYRRDYLTEKNLRFQDLQHSNDVYFVLSSILLADRVAAVKGQLVHYRINEDSIQGHKTDPECPLLALKAVQKCVIDNDIFLDRRTEIFLNAKFTDLEIGALITSVSGNTKVQDVWSEFSRYSRNLGPQPAFRKINGPMSLMYWSFSRCSLKAARWAIAAKGTGRKSTRLQRYRFATRLVLAGTFCKAPQT